MSPDGRSPNDPPPPARDDAVVGAGSGSVRPAALPLVPASGTPPAAAATLSTHGLLTVGAILALLYFARAVLVPVTLAVVLSFAVAPLVRGLRRFGFGHALSVLAAVSTLGLLLLALAGVIGVQTVQMASNLGAYEQTVKDKVQTLRLLTVARMAPVWTTAERVLALAPPDEAGGGPARGLEPGLGRAIPVEVREPPPSALALGQRALAAVFGPLGTTGIVVIVLIFVLLEQEALRDRFIRLVGGGADLRMTTTAINDAGERLSRYFLRQFAVNIGVGVVLWAALAAIGLPHATLWAALAAVLRFVPYAGMPLATLLAGTLAFAVDPGWNLLLATLAVFVVVQTFVAQVVEPRLYGQATGLSPLAIVLATLFWGWLWGPIGVIMSTPLTLCLAVAGRHSRSLGFLDIVLGDGPGLTMPQKFYQRALSGDADEIIEGALEFLRRKPLATYCDSVLFPALALARKDVRSGLIAPSQGQLVRGALVRVVEAIDGASTRLGRLRAPRQSMLNETNPGRALRERRLRREGIERAGRVDSRSIVLCIGLDAMGDELAAELLVRVLRSLHLEAHHLELDEWRSNGSGALDADRIAAACVVTVDPRAQADAVRRLAGDLRTRLPQASIVAMLMRDPLGDEEPVVELAAVDRVAASFEEAALELGELAATFAPDG